MRTRLLPALRGFPSLNQATPGTGLPLVRQRRISLCFLLTVTDSSNPNATGGRARIFNRKPRRKNFINLIYKEISLIIVKRMLNCLFNDEKSDNDRQNGWLQPSNDLRLWSTFPSNKVNISIRGRERKKKRKKNHEKSRHLRTRLRQKIGQPTRSAHTNVVRDGSTFGMCQFWTVKRQRDLIACQQPSCFYSKKNVLLLLLLLQWKVKTRQRCEMACVETWISAIVFIFLRIQTSSWSSSW